MKKGRFNPAKIKFGILAVLVLIFAAVYIITAIKGYGLSDGIKGFVTSNPKLSPVIFTALFIVGAFFPLPLLTIAGATIFSFWEVFACSLIGNIINATIIFYLARWLGRDFVKIFEEKHKLAKRLDMNLKKHPVRDMVLLRFFYIIPAEVGNLVGGLSGINYRDYLWGILLGMIPVLFASILLVKGNLADNGLMIAIATIILILLILMPLIYLSAIRRHAKEQYRTAKKSAKEFVGLRK